MKYTIDTHTHTLVSGHAYNTIDEMAAYAAGIGVTHLAITDHAPKMPGRAGILYFSNMNSFSNPITAPFKYTFSLAVRSGSNPAPSSINGAMDPFT